MKKTLNLHIEMISSNENDLKRIINNIYGYISGFEEVTVFQGV